VNLLITKLILPISNFNSELIFRIAGGYFKVEEKSKELWRGGWMHTGDIAYCDEEGYVKITARPVAFVVYTQDAPSEEETEKAINGTLKSFVETGKIEKWAIPNKFIKLDGIPKTSVGKLDKKLLRTMYAEKYA